MTEKKICTYCKEEKEIPEDFYRWRGFFKSECKKCTILRNGNYQKRVQAWKMRSGEGDVRNAYMRAYYAKNKEKFALYRRQFLDKHPDYYKDYFRKKKE